MSLMDPGSVREFTATSSRAPNRMSYPLIDRWSAALNTSFAAALAKVELRRPAGLPQHERKRWAELAARATPGNIFAQDWFMEPALRHCGREWSLRLAIVRQASGEWLGALPLVMSPAAARVPAPALHGWHSADQFLGTPLVLPGAEKAFWQALLAWLDRKPGVALGLCCGPMPVSDPVTLALASLCAEQGRTMHVSDSFTRPARLFSSQPDPLALGKLDDQLDALEARLAGDLGPVRMVLHDSSDSCDPWVAAFLALERAGWSGQASSALACDSASTALFREVIRHGHRSGTVRLASLTAGEKIMAMTSWFVGGGHAYGFKMAFDEAYLSAAPGQLLMRQVARTLDGEPPVLFDTCTARDVPADPLWPDRRAFGTFAVAIGSPARRRLFDALMRAKTGAARKPGHKT